MSDTTETTETDVGQSKAPAAEDSGLPLRIPEGIRYNCQGCGRCCAGWAVGLTDEDYARVKDVDWGSLHEDLKDKELFVHRQSEFEQGLSMYPHFTKARPDGTCPFLIDNLCFIHSKFGEPTKPGMCKLFPYTYVPTPSGIYVGLVYNSMSSVRNLGELLSNQRPMLEETWRLMVNQERAQGRASNAVSAVAESVKASDLAAVQYNVNLVSTISLTWQEYLKIDDRLIALVSAADHKNAYTLLLSASEILAEAVRLKTAGSDLGELSTFQPEVDRFIDETPTGVENALFNLLCFRNFEWPQIRKQYAAFWSAANKSPLSDPKILMAGTRAVLQGKLELSGLGLISIEKARRYRVRPFSAEIEQFFARYLYLKVFSKTFCGPPMSGLSIVAGFNNIIANFLSAIVFAKAHAMSRNESEIRLSDLYEAYFLLDKEVVQLSQLPKDKVQFYDSGFSSPRLFSRLLGQLCATTLETSAK